MNKTQTFEINWFAAAGSALGAVSSAVLLSTLGAAGTLAGAALGSLTITVGGSIYTQSLQKTKARVDTLRATGSVPRQDPGQTAVDPVATAGSSPVQSPKPPRKPLGETLRGLPWKRITVLAVGLFVVTMVVILSFELSTGRPVSSFTGGSSETRTGTTFNRAKPSSDTPAKADPSASATPSVEGEPTATPTEDKQPTKVEPTEEPTTATEKPTEQTPTEPPAPAEPAAPVEPEPETEAPAAVVVPPVEIAPAG